ncbi:PREDICTED: serpin B10-like [Rhagoletis zephyria]|uniref:serpin B10-like n=1 Tax=Rhagoletis zephyria TaxID=28612 RepID=UPI00081175DE|nr:PREDICTED: serpin B10-like [Rhagoletis zephyria]
MAMTGAISDTREEIKRTLGNVFQLANAAALIDQFALLTAYQNTVENDFSATIFSVNLSEAATTINNWANEHTHGKIPKLLDEKTDLSNTVMILLNALYFKGVWANPFKKQLTADKEFTYSANSKVKVPMMSKSGWFKYTSSTEGQLLELPYEEPVQELQSMGIRAAFDCEKANFSLMMDSERIIKVSEILQKTFIEVNEEGSKAAAATAVGFVAVSGQIRKPLTVEFNRPFLFAIRDNRLQLTLFAGIVNKP